MRNWVARIGEYDVRKKESPRPGGQPYIGLEHPRAFVIHTTEGSSIEGAWNTLDAKGAAPHFIVGEDQIWQTRPLDAQAATLVDAPWHPNSVGWQVESVGFSRESPVNKLSIRTWKPLVALTAFMADEMGVPLRRPNGWKDDLSDIGTILATTLNTRRRSEVAKSFHGLLGHLDIPDNSHWDPGALDYTALIDEAKGDEDMGFEEFKQGVKAANQGDELPEGSDADFIFGYRMETRGTTQPRPTPPGEAGPHEHTVKVLGRTFTTSEPVAPSE